MSQPFSTEASRVNYLKGLIRVAKCNGVVEPEQREYFNLAAKGFQLSDQAMKEVDSSWEEKGPIMVSFNNRYDAVFFLQEALQVSVVDGVFDDLERAELRILSKELGIKIEDYEAIENWVYQGLEWRKMGEELIGRIANKEA